MKTENSNWRFSISPFPGSLFLFAGSVRTNVISTACGLTQSNMSAVKEAREHVCEDDGMW